MRYRDQNSNLKAHILSLRWMVIAEFLLILALWHGWEKAREDIRIHIPPDLRSGAVVPADRAAPSNVYTFAAYIFQQLNRWPQDGSKDYGRQVFRLSAFLTPRFREFLFSDIEFRGKRGELSGRTRALQLIPGRAYAEDQVALPSPEVFEVQLDVNIRETVRGMDVKSVNIRYPLRVVRYDVDPELNPWGLALDGYAGDGPRHLTRRATSPAVQGGEE